MQDEQTLYRINQCLEEILDLPTTAWPDYLQALAGKDSAFAKEFGQLLKAQQPLTEIIHEPTPSMAQSIDAPLPEGHVIGCYQVLKPIGEGGMGKVYLARRTDDIEIMVAIKVLKPAGLGPTFFNRFRQEKKILSSLNHPHICRILDGGQIDDRGLWFAMEYIEGEALDTYCNQRGLGIADRLGIFLNVCEGVSYAHQNLVIHRDLKPSNILVDQRGHPKLLDFGIARFLDGETGMQRTQTCEKLMTPEYASPEQIRGETLGTGCDVYALGVLAFQLLSGCHPHHGSRENMLHLIRAICEEEPKRMSRAYLESDSERISRERATTVRGLSSSLSGDLEVIVSKCLQKEVSRRYPSVAALAEDVQLYLQGRPIKARPATMSYRIGKFAARHRLALSLTGILFFVSASLLFLIYRQGETVRQERKAALRVSQFLTQLFEDANPWGTQQGEIRVEDLLDRGVRTMDRDLEDDPLLRARLTGVISKAYEGLARFEKARDLLTVQLACEAYPPEQRATLLYRLGLAQWHLGDYEASRATSRELLSLREAGSLSPGASLRALYLAAKANHGKGDFETAAGYYRQALDAAPDLAEREPHLLLQLNSNYGDLMADMEQLTEAEDIYRGVLRRAIARYGDKHAFILGIEHNLGALLSQQRRYPQAETMLRRVLAKERDHFGSDHPKVATTLHNLSKVMGKLGKHQEIRRSRQRIPAHQTRGLWRRSRTRLQRPGQPGPFSPAPTMITRRRKPLLTEALAGMKRNLTEHHPWIINTGLSLAYVQVRAGNLDSAQRQYRESLALGETSLGSKHYRVRWLKQGLAECLELRGEHAQALSILASLEKALLEDEMGQGKDLAEVYFQTASNLTGLGRFDESLTMLEKGRSIWNSLDKENPWQLAWSDLLVARNWQAQERKTEARDLMVRAVDRLLEVHGTRAFETQRGLRVSHAASQRLTR